MLTLIARTFLVDYWVARWCSSQITIFTPTPPQTSCHQTKHNHFLIILCISDYLKGIQAIEILALLSGVTAIGIWIAYIVMSTRTRKGVASTVVKIIAIVLIILTGESIFLPGIKIPTSKTTDI